MAAKFAKIGTSRRNRYELSSEINVTPLVDVMLVLLVIFMVTSPMLVAGVNVDLPKTSASPISSQEEPLSVTVNAEGKIFLQNTEVSTEELVAKLQAILGEKMDTRIFVRGDQRIDYGTIMKVIGTMNAAGFTKVALLTDIATDGGK